MVKIQDLLYNKNSNIGRLKKYIFNVSYEKNGILRWNCEKAK